MRTLLSLIAAASLALGLSQAARAAEPLQVVAAENFYGEVAAAIGGDRVKVTSILNSPDQDPHAFEATAATARTIAGAALVIYNGAHYDDWMPKLLAASRSKERKVVEVAKLAGRKAGDNPHLWYDPAVMRAAGKAIAAAFSAADPAGEAGYTTRLGAFLTGLDALDARVADIRRRHAGAEVGATEPVFGYMAAALGLKMRNERFQLSVMNETEPSARDIAAFEQDLKGRRVKLVIHNSQVSDPLADRLLGIAREAGVPVVGVTETQPAGKTYGEWMLSQLDAVDAALTPRTQ